MASAIARNQPAAAASVQQFCDCGGGTCCQGGWPETAFSWMVAQGNVSTNTAYPYWAQDGRDCSLQPDYPIAGNVSGWERVPMYSQSALIRAVSMQPVMVYISASSSDFVAYTSTPPGTPGFTVYDGNCSTEVNHAVVIMGYNTTATTPYWIVKNTWPSWGWGHDGYMYLAMVDGPGKCGMLTVSPLYPTHFPTAPVQLATSPGSSVPTLKRDDVWWKWWTPAPQGDPCAGIINPCGSGTCYNSSGIARCRCVAPYVEAEGVPTSKCVHPSPCTTSQFSPCGGGWCLDIGDGGYTCGCPAGYTIGAQVNGNPTCIPILRSLQRLTYTTQYRDSCSSIADDFNLTLPAFAAQNPSLRCSRRFVPPGQVVTTGPKSILCTQQYAIRRGDSCATIAYNMDANSNFLSTLRPSYYSSNSSAANSSAIPPSYNASVPSLSPAGPRYNPQSLLTLNPTLRCNTLYSSQLVCVDSPSVLDTSTIQCGTTYTAVRWDTCASVQAAFGLSSSSFQQLNPGINCRAHKGFITPGFQLCVAPLNFTVDDIANCTQYYTLQQGDSCAQIWNAANLSMFQFMYINPGLQCQAPYLFVGKRVCIDSALLVNIPDPSYFLYTVQPNDTLALIQAQFTAKCNSYSISLPRIAAQNNISDWTTWTPHRGILVIPCLPRIGAQCGCAPSLTVCGGDFLNYPSYCDATCNFASPISPGPCTACQSACAGRYGFPPDPSSACPSGYICPYPLWPPDQTDASKAFTCPGCLCNYRKNTCSQACASAVNLVGTTYSSCYGACMANWLVPCGGPSQLKTANVYPCNSCGWTLGDPCNPWGKTGTTCMTNSSYWNNWWTSTPDGFNP